MFLRITLSGAAAIIIVGLAACGLDPGGPYNGSSGGGTNPALSGGAVPNDDAFQRFDATCPASSPRLPGTSGPGVQCSSASACSPTCCACPAQPQAWLAASCVAGTCADGMTACARTQTSNCTGGAPIIIGGGVSSPAQSQCNTCISTSCWTTQQACNENAACVALESCDAQCGSDAQCSEGCFEANAAGEAALQALDACVANACGAACEP